MNSKITSTKRVVHLIKTGFLSFFFFALIQSQAFSQSVIFPAVDVSGTHLYAYNKTTGNVGRIYTNKGITSTFSAGLGPFGQTLLYNGDYYGYFDLGKTGLSLARFDENGLVELDATFALRSVHDIIEMNGKIYTLATTNSSSTTDVHVYEYDPNTSSTTKITSSLHDCYKALDLEVYNSGSGNKLYFGGRSSASNSYSDLYNYDGTNLAVAPNFNYSTPYYMAVFNGELHLGASPSGQDSDSRSVKYNGSSSSQVLVTNTNTGLFLKEDLPQYYIVFNNKLYFKSSIRTGSTSNDRLDNALYSVNTSGNVTKEYEIPKPADISTINGPSYMFESGGSLYFIADDNLNSDSELFRFNSTNNVTKVTNTTNQRFIQSPRPYDGGVFFWQERVQNDGNEPYYFNLSDNTYTSLGDIKPGTGSSYSSTNFGANKTYVGELAPYVYVPESSVTVRQNTASLVTTTLEVVEIDNNSFTAVSVEIVSGFQSGDVLAVTDQHGITSSYNASSGVLTLGNLGSATPAQVQDVLNSLKITASNTTTKSLVYKATDSDNNTNDITNTTAAKVDAVVSTLVLSNLTFDAQPNRTSTITPVGSFTISDSNLGEVVFKTTNDPLSTAFESLTLQFASDNGLRYDDNNKELQVLTDDNAASPIFSAFKADNEFNFQSFSVIDRQFGLFDRYIVTGLLNGSQEFQETFNVAAPTVKETLTTSSTNRAKNVNEIRVEGVYSTDPDSYGFGAHLDNILVALPAAANTAPAFESDLSGGSHTVSLEENSPLGKLVYNVSANDGDGGSTDTGVTYSITAGNTNQDSDNSSSSVSANLLPFKIDNATGQIYVNDPGDLNFEGTNSFALTIEASDGANQTTATLTINLTDQTESGPIDGEYRFTTGDGWPSTYTDATTHTGTYFSLISQSSGNIQMIASDEGFWLNNNTDLANGTIRVQADGTDMTEFDLADVMVYKYNNALITAGSFSVTFTGHKSAGSTVSTTGINTSGDSGWSTLPEFSDFTALDYFDIAITDTESGTNNLINYGFHRLYFANSKSTPPNTAPVITASQSFDVTEDAANSTAVGTVVATDADSDPLSSWTITAGNGDGIFAVNSGTGAITVTDNTNLDYETTTSYTLTLTVSDGSATSSAQTVTVNVTDVDEVAPVFENSTPSSSAITQTGFALSTDIDEAGIIYYVVVSNGVGVPTSAQVKAGQNSSGGSPITSGNAAVTTGGFTNDFSVTGLTAGTDYDVYVVAQDDEATPNIQTNPTKVAVSTITQSSSQNISTLYGTTVGYSGDGNLATNAKIDGPTDLVYDTSGNLFFVDGRNNVVRKIDTNGIITTIAGNGTQGYSGDGGLATSAQLNAPYGITFDTNDNLFISEIGNHTIRKIDSNGIITTIAGNGTPGYSGDGGLATSAQLHAPYGITFDTNDNLFIGERNNNIIRKVDTNGIITTIAGNGTPGYSGDGGLAINALLGGCRSVAFNDNGDLYISDGNNHAVRKIDVNGIITTVAGNGTQGYSGDGSLATSAKINFPRFVIFDNFDNFYFSESSSHVIRKVDNTGKISTVAGNGTQGYSGDGGLATSAQLNGPFGIILDSKDVGGNLIFCDNNNNVIRKVENVVIDNSPKTLIVTGLAGNNKEYDGTTDATAIGTASLSGVIGTDNVSLVGSPIFTFASSNVGTGITVTTTGYTLSGTDAGKYSLTQPILLSDITAKELTITGSTGDDKVYDGTTAATSSGTPSLSGLIGTDDVSLGGSPVFTFASANVGTVITITTTGYSISGTDLGNYSLTQPTLSADITAKSLSVTGLTGEDKVYDGATAATSSGTPVLSGVIGTDDVILGGSPVFTFASASAGTGITIISTGYSISGTEVANYSLTQPTLSADITAKSLTITGLTGDNKVYDGTASATVSGTAALSGVVGIDDVSLGDSPVFT
ncbi:MAG: YDG domain-containing protein, partial [Cyclobacteriaceae bacterium]